MVTKRDIREYAEKLGFAAIGFTDGTPLSRIKEVLKAREDKGYLSGLEAGTLQERCCPHLHLKDVKTVISVGLPYQHFCPPGDSYPTGELLGMLSCCALGEDYHKLVKEKLELLAEFISERIANFRYLVMVDTGPLVDREIAYRAGLGWYGKNCSIITPSHGSAVFLGEMLTNLDLEADPALEKECGECSICLEMCPTGALVAPYTLDARRCISYLTQMKGVIPRELRRMMGTSIYGCDRCQQYCPYNRKIIKDHRGNTLVDLKELLDMGKREFSARFGKSAAGWRGLNLLKRNAVIALGNLKREEGLPLLEKAIKHPSPVIRGHAAWAIGQIGGIKGKGILKKALASERDPYVLKEIQDALAEL